jgi:hypothetical protein
MTSIKAIVGLLQIAVVLAVGVVTFGATQASASDAPIVILNAKMCNELAGHCEGTANGVEFRTQAAVRAPSTPDDTDRCTMAVPEVRATVEVRMPYAPDFCEIASQVLGGNVFRAPVLVSPGVLWHYSGTALSCRLRYKKTRASMTIRQSAAACHWLLRRGRGWHLQAPVGAGTPRRAPRLFT